MLWNRKVFSVIFFSYFVFTGCHTTKFASEKHPLTTALFVNLDKVKIEYSDRNQKFSIRGYIRFKVDSSFCFQFWGPLGYQILKGCSSGGRLATVSKMENPVSYELLRNALGISFDELLLQNLLLGQDTLFIKRLLQLNPSIVTLEHFYDRRNRNTISVTHNITKKQLILNFVRKDGSLKSIELFIKPDLLKISIQIGEISYNDKISNFEL